jgi:LCP family protein required for cell wall assembly
MKRTVVKRRDQRGPVLLAIAIGLGSGLLVSAPLRDHLREQASSGQKLLANPFAAWANIGQQNVVVLGTDEGGGNTDVITVVRVGRGSTHMLQIPRDTYIDSPRFGPLKINALYAVGGIDALEEELTRQLGRPIHHHVVMNLGAIRKMADALGGIEVDVPKRMVYDDYSQGLHINLQPGLQTLQGRDLEGFLRFRHDEEGDLGRLDRQKLAIRALFSNWCGCPWCWRAPARACAPTSGRWSSAG